MFFFLFRDPLFLFPAPSPSSAIAASLLLTFDSLLATFSWYNGGVERRNGGFVQSACSKTLKDGRKTKEVVTGVQGIVGNTMTYKMVLYGGTAPRSSDL